MSIPAQPIPSGTGRMRTLFTVTALGLARGLDDPWSSLENPFVAGAREVTYEGAVAYCERIGLAIATIRSAGENDRARLACGTRSCWIGLDEVGGANGTSGSTQVWAWSGGEFANYTNWAPAEPRNATRGGDRRAIVGWSDAESTWFAVDGEDFDAAVPLCSAERGPTAAPTVSAAPTSSAAPTAGGCDCSCYWNGYACSSEDGDEDPRCESACGYDGAYCYDGGDGCDDFGCDADGDEAGACCDAAVSEDRYDDGICGAEWASSEERVDCFCQDLGDGGRFVRGGFWDRSWSECRDACAALGLSLPCLRTAAESEALAALAPYAAWLGFSDAGTEGTWTWEAGCDSTYANWADGEPNSFGATDEDCAVVWGEASGRGGGAWNDDNCDCFHTGRLCGGWPDDWEDEWWEDEDEDEDTGPHTAAAGVVIIVVLVVVILVIGSVLAYLYGRVRTLEARGRDFQRAPHAEVAAVEAVHAPPPPPMAPTVELAPLGLGGEYAGVVVQAEPIKEGPLGATHTL